MNGSPIAGVMDTHLHIVPNLMANEEEGNSEMILGECNYAHVRKNKSLTSIESLPDELVFNILVYLPAEDIYNCAMLVCWKWYRMIRSRNFVDSHLQHSTPGLLVQNPGYQNNASIFVAMRKGRIEASKFSYELRQGSWASCNGLILEYDYSKGSAQIINPAIKQLFAIPQIFHRSLNYHKHKLSIAYSAVSKEYKAVHEYQSQDGDLNVTRWAILTVGVDDSWRHICTQHLPETIIGNKSYMVEGFIHWCAGGTHVLTLNVETEVMTQNPVPQGYEGRCKHYLSTGKSLSMLVRCSELSFEVWDMESQSGEWSKTYNVDLDAHECKFDELRREENAFSFVLIPIGWLKYQEVLVFYYSHPTRVCIAYNVVTQEVDFVELGF